MFGLQYFLSKVPMLDLVSDAPNYRTISTITALRRRLNYMSAQRILRPQLSPLLSVIHGT